MIATRGAYFISTDPSALNIDLIHQFLGSSYWAAGIPRATVEKAIAGSLCFGIYLQTEAGPVQAGFARVVTDKATFAYLADVFVNPAHQGAGLGKWLIATILAHPDLQGLRRFMLATRDAHGLYAQYGFVPIAQPERLMQIVWPDIYRQNT